MIAPSIHVATILRERRVRRTCTADTHFRKFDFLEVTNPLPYCRRLDSHRAAAAPDMASRA